MRTKIEQIKLPPLTMLLSFLVVGMYMLDLAVSDRHQSNAGRSGRPEAGLVECVGDQRVIVRTPLGQLFDLVQKADATLRGHRTDRLAGRRRRGGHRTRTGSGAALVQLFVLLDRLHLFSVFGMKISIVLVSNLPFDCLRLLSQYY